MLVITVDLQISHKYFNYFYVIGSFLDYHSIIDIYKYFSQCSTETVFLLCLLRRSPQDQKWMAFAIPNNLQDAQNHLSIDLRN